MAGRMTQQSINLIAVMRKIAQAAKPITGRGIGYKLFTHKPRLIDSMKRMPSVYRLLRIAREEGIIPWEWIVDESRSEEKAQAWKNPDAFAEVVARAYRRDFWGQQRCRLKVVSEKGTVRGVLGPVLDKYAVDFLPVHGFSSATKVKDVCNDSDGLHPLILLYVGDYDPSGMCMSERDLPRRLGDYGALRYELRRIAVTLEQTSGLQSFPAIEKRTDSRYPWFVRNYGRTCWELDAMDPNDLRDCVEQEIRSLIDWDAWERCELVNDAEKESLRTILEKWKGRAA